MSVLMVIVVIVFVSVGESLSDQISSLNGNVSLLEDTVKDKDDIIREQKETILSYTKANKTLKKSLSTAESELSEAKANISSLTAQNASLQHNIMELNAKVSDLSRQNRSLNSQVAGLNEELKRCRQTSSTSSMNTQDNYRSSSNAVTIYSQNETVKVGQRIRANLKEGKITRWEVKSSQSSCVRASGDELIVVGPGAVYVWGYIDRTPKLFNITAVRK